MLDTHEVVAVGYARVTPNAPSHTVHGSFVIALRIDTRTNVVTQADATSATALVREWISELLVGADFGVEPDAILAHVDRCYLGHAQGSIKQAITDAYRRYQARPLPTPLT